MSADEKRNPLGKKSYAERKTEAPQTLDQRERPMTYRIGDELIERVNQVAEQHNVEKGGLVKVLLSYGLDALDDGEITLDEMLAEVKKRPRKLDI